MSGYEVEDTVYKLVFPDTEYEGLEIRVRAMSMAQRLHAVFDLSAEPGDTMADARAKQRELHQMLVEHVVDWNLQRAGEPIPVTLDGLYSLEPEFVGTITGVWQVGRAAVPAPLDEPSSTTSEVEEHLAALPTESLAS